MPDIASHSDMVAAVVQLAEAVGLEASTFHSHGQRIWGADRVIDVLLYHPNSHERVGIECRFDSGSGKEAERVLTLMADVQTWVMRGVIVVAGKGFESYLGMLCGKGLVVRLPELGKVLPFYFETQIQQRRRSS